MAQQLTVVLPEGLSLVPSTYTVVVYSLRLWFERIQSSFLPSVGTVPGWRTATHAGNTLIMLTK